MLMLAPLPRFLGVTLSRLSLIQKVGPIGTSTTSCFYYRKLDEPKLFLLSGLLWLC
jgi:hypothetical protein